MASEGPLAGLELSLPSELFQALACLTTGNVSFPNQRGCGSAAGFSLAVTERKQEMEKRFWQDGGESVVVWGGVREEKRFCLKYAKRVFCSQQSRLRPTSVSESC